MKTATLVFFSFVFEAGMAFGQTFEPSLPVEPLPESPIVVTAQRQTVASLTGLYKLISGKTLIVAADLQNREIAVGPFTASKTEALQIVLGSLKEHGMTIRPMTPEVDLVALAIAYDATGGSLAVGPLPRVGAGTEKDLAPAAIAGTVAPVGVPEKPLATRVVVIEAELGAVALGKRYETGVDLLAALDDFSASNTPGGIAAGSSVGGGFKAFQLAASARPLSNYIKLLDSDSDYTSMARPRMQVLEGETGTIATGQRVAVPTQTLTSLQGQASTTSNIQYEDVKLSLSITPTVREDGRIALRIEQSDDSISGSQVLSGNTVPTIASQTFSTTTLVRPLATIALGGIKIERERKSTKGPRGLARMPFLGRLFRVDGSDAQKSELVIFVTAWLAE